MTLFKTPTQYQHINYKTQYGIVNNYINPKIQLSRTINKLTTQIGNDIVLKGLDIKYINTTNNQLIVTFCKGNLIQDFTFIEILNDFNVILNDLNTYDFNNGYVIIYTHYKYFETIQDNKLSIHINYISNNGLIEWDHEYNRIILAAIHKNKFNKFDIYYLPKYFVIDQYYYYKGHINYNLLNIINDWSIYLDYFGYYNILEYKNQGNRLHEVDIEILDNDYFDIDIKNKYDVNRLMIDVSFYDNNETSNYYNFWTKERLPNLITYEKTQDYVRIYNNSDDNLKTIISLLDDIESYNETIVISNEHIFNLNDCFNENIHSGEVIVQCYEIQNNNFIITNNININKYNNSIKLTNTEHESVILNVIIYKANYNETNIISYSSYKDYNIEQLFNLNVSELSVFTDLYILDNNEFIKNDKLDIVKFDSFIRIYNRTENPIEYNILLSQMATNFMNNNCDIDNLLYTKLSLNKIGNGQGTILSDNFSCGEKCQDIIVKKNEEIELCANPTSDSLFVGWDGCDYVENDKCYIRCNNKRLVTAKFVKIRSLTINIHGDGEVYSSPIGIDPQNLTHDFIKNKNITLVGIPINPQHQIKWVDGSNILFNNVYTIVNITDNKIVDVYFGDNL